MSTKQEINEADTTVIPADFDAGDKLYIQTPTGNILLGTVMESREDRMTLKKGNGDVVVFSNSSSPSLDYVLKKVGRYLDVNNLYEQDIISRISRDGSGKAFREYAEVVATYADTDIKIRFINGATPGKIQTYSVDPYGTLEEKMISWEVEE